MTAVHHQGAAAAYAAKHRAIRPAAGAGELLLPCESATNGELEHKGMFLFLFTSVSRTGGGSAEETVVGALRRTRTLQQSQRATKPQPRRRKRMTSVVDATPQSGHRDPWKESSQ